MPGAIVQPLDNDVGVVPSKMGSQQTGAGVHRMSPSTVQTPWPNAERQKEILFLRGRSDALASICGFARCRQSQSGHQSLQQNRATEPSFFLRKENGNSVNILLSLECCRASLVVSTTVQFSNAMHHFRKLRCSYRCRAFSAKLMQLCTRRLTSHPPSPRASSSSASSACVVCAADFNIHRTTERQPIAPVSQVARPSFQPVRTLEPRQRLQASSASCASSVSVPLILLSTTSEDMLQSREVFVSTALCGSPLCSSGRNVRPRGSGRRSNGATCAAQLPKSRQQNSSRLQRTERIVGPLITVACVASHKIRLEKKENKTYCCGLRCHWLSW